MAVLRLIAAVLGSATCVVITLAAHQAQSSEFRILLAQYRGTDAERTVRLLASWSEDRESREAPRLSRETVAGDPWAAAAQAALHLESGRARWNFQTGRPTVALHLGQDIVESLVAVARQTGDARLLGFCRDWYVIADTLMREPQGGYVPFELGPNGLESPRRQLGDDPEILTLLGTAPGGFIGPEELEGSYIHPIDGGKALFGGRWYSRSHAHDAEGYYRKALARDSRFAEARLRLGRVLQLVGDPTAEEELAQAANSSDDVVAYLAHLFLGQGREFAGRLADAEADYRAAIARHPAGTVARLALSQVLFQTGDSAAAWTASRSVFVPETMSAARDPWAAFPVYNFWNFNDRFARLRAQVSASPWHEPAVAPIPQLVYTEPAGRTLRSETPQAIRPMFRGGVDAVPVEVLVTDGGRGVPNLTSRDFVLTDNGVPQTLDRMTTSWGLHVALVVDTSRSVWPAAPWRQVEAGAAAVVRALTPDDRLSVLTISERLTLLANAVPPNLAAPVLARLKPADPERAEFTALWDAVFASTSLVADAPGRALVIALSDGMDTVSWFDRRATPTRLQRLGITVDGVEVDMIKTQGINDRQHLWSDIIVGPFGLAPLQVTGGQIFPGHDRDLADRLAKRFNRLRAGYVLYYTPANTTPGKDNWHEIKVTLRPGLIWKVQARPGYCTSAQRSDYLVSTSRIRNLEAGRRISVVRIDELEEAALQLKPEGRARLAERLLELGSVCEGS